MTERHHRTTLSKEEQEVNESKWLCQAFEKTKGWSQLPATTPGKYSELKIQEYLKNTLISTSPIAPPSIYQNIKTYLGA